MHFYSLLQSHIKNEVGLIGKRRQTELSLLDARHGDGINKAINYNRVQKAINWKEFRRLSVFFTRSRKGAERCLVTKIRHDLYRVSTDILNRSQTHPMLYISKFSLLSAKNPRSKASKGRKLFVPKKTMRAKNAKGKWKKKSFSLFVDG